MTQWVAHSHDGHWWRLMGPPGRPDFPLGIAPVLGYVRRDGDVFQFTWGGIEWCGAHPTMREAARRVELHGRDVLNG